MNLKMLLPALALVATAACTDTPALGRDQALLARIPRGSTCAELGLGNQQLTLTAPAGGTYALDAQNSLTLTYYDDSNTIFYFHQSTLPITGVLASIGGETLVWDMPEGQTAYPSLHGPNNRDTGAISPPEEVSFCYDYNLRIQPSPYTNQAQLATWTLTKSGPTAPYELALNQSELADYEIKVSPGSTPTYLGQYVEGPVYVTNASPYTITVGDVTTEVGTIAATVTCPTPPPFVVAPFATVTCSFHADVPDTADYNVVGGGTSSHGLRVTTRELVASFSSHNNTIQTQDRCVTVRDDAAPAANRVLGVVCREQGETTFRVTAEIGPFATCGPFAVTKTASFTGNTTGAFADAPWTVTGEVACNPGCTLPAAYWRYHARAGTKRYHPTWGLVGPQGEKTSFFRANANYIQAMSRLALRNVYWTLARAYIAARLNQLNGVQFPAATQAAFNQATTLFNTYTPLQAILANSAQRRSVIALAAALADFNNGVVGPGRCTAAPDLED